MTDHFALLGEARRPFLDPEKLKEKYHARSREAQPDAELNEAFRVLSDPKLRLHHLLLLEGADLPAGRAVPPAVAELFWETGNVLRETDGWLQRNAAASSNLARAMLHPARTKLERKLADLEEQLHAKHTTALAELQRLDAAWQATAPNDLPQLVQLYDTLAYLTRLLERTAEKRLQLQLV